MKFEIKISEKRDWRLTFEVDVKDFYTYLEEDMDTKLHILGANDNERKFHQRMLEKVIETGIQEYIDCKVFRIKNKAANHIQTDEPWDYIHDKVIELWREYPLWFVLEDTSGDSPRCDCCNDEFEEEDDIQYPELYGHIFNVCEKCLKKYFESPPPVV